MSDPQESTLANRQNDQQPQDNEIKKASNSLTIDIQQSGHDEQEDYNNSIEFALTSPTNVLSKLKSNSPELKKIKYEKMAKMHQKNQEKLKKLNENADQLESKKKIYQQLKSKFQLAKQNQQNKTIFQKSQAKIKQLRKQTDQVQNEIAEREALKNEKLANIERAKNQIKLEVQKLRQQFAQIERSKAQHQSSICNTQVQQLITQRKQLQAKLLGLNSNIIELHKTKNMIQVQLNPLRLAVSQKEEELGNERNVDEVQKISEKQFQILNQRILTVTQECRKLQDQKKQLDQAISKLKKSQAELKDKEAINNTKIADVQRKRKDIEGAFNKQRDNLEKLQAKNFETVEKSEKHNPTPQQLEEQQKIKKLQKQKNALRQKIRKVQQKFEFQKQKGQKLVPQNVISEYEHKLEKLKSTEKQFTRLSRQNEKLSKENIRLQQQKEQLQWSQHPELKILQSKKSQNQKILPQIDEQLKTMRKEAVLLHNKVDEYAKTYPEFDIQSKIQGFLREKIQRQLQRQRKAAAKIQKQQPINNTGKSNKQKKQKTKEIVNQTPKYFQKVNSTPIETKIEQPKAQATQQKKRRKKNKNKGIQQPQKAVEICIQNQQDSNSGWIQVRPMKSQAVKNSSEIKTVLQEAKNQLQNAAEQGKKKKKNKKKKANATEQQNLKEQKVQEISKIQNSPPSQIKQAKISSKTQQTPQERHQRRESIQHSQHQRQAAPEKPPLYPTISIDNFDQGENKKKNKNKNKNKSKLSVVPQVQKIQPITKKTQQVAKVSNNAEQKGNGKKKQGKNRKKTQSESSNDSDVVNSGLKQKESLNAGTIIVGLVLISLLGGIFMMTLY